MHSRPAIAALLLVALPLGAQTKLADRVAAVRDGELQFEFPAREGACGNGVSYIRVDGDVMNGDWSDIRETKCVAGPVRIVLRKEAGEIVSLRDYVGPVPSVSGRTELGEVSSEEGASFLLGLADRGAPARVAGRAIFPAMLGRGVVAWPALLRIARNREHSRPNDTMLWLSRCAAAKLEGSDDPFSVDHGDRTDEEDVKDHAVFALSQLRGREGVDPLIQVARTNKDAGVRAKALFWLGQSGDPRALDLFEEILNGRVAPPRR